MIAHERLVEDVTRRARLANAEEGGRVVRVALAAVAHHLDMPLRQRLRQALPGPEREAVYATVPPVRVGLYALLEEVARNLETTPEHARFLAQTVLSEICEIDPELGREMRGGLPEEFGELFVPPPAHPERIPRASGAPAPLTEDELREALRRRPQWSGDVHHLTREVGLPGDRIPPLLNRVGKAARNLHHHPGYEQSADGIVFTLRTRSVDAVTELDLDLADAIDAAVAAVGSGGRPG